MPLPKEKKKHSPHSPHPGQQEGHFPSSYESLLHAASLSEPQQKAWIVAFEELEEFYNNSPCGFHSLDPNGLIIRMNDTELRWLGYDRNEIVGKRLFTDLLHPSSRKSFQQHFASFKRKGRLQEIEYEMLKKDGSGIPVLLNAAAVYDEEGRFQMSRATVFDISIRKNMERTLVEKNAMLANLNERISRLQMEKEQFLGIFIHNLQHPLASLSLLSEVLINQAGKEGSPDLDISRLVHEASVQMSDLVRNYLNAERIEKGNFPVNIQTIDLATLVARVMKRYQLIAAKKEISIVYEGPQALHFATDKELLSQILENLLSNAVKYTYTGMQVSIRLQQGKKNISLSVIDQGQGISSDEIPLLFKRFQTLSVKPTGGEHSTGLGLSIVEYLTGLLGGKVIVQSEPGKGSNFSLYFPKTD